MWGEGGGADQISGKYWIRSTYYLVQVNKRLETSNLSAEKTRREPVVMVEFPAFGARKWRFPVNIVIIYSKIGLP